MRHVDLARESVPAHYIHHNGTWLSLPNWYQPELSWQPRIVHLCQPRFKSYYSRHIAGTQALIAVVREL